MRRWLPLWLLPHVALAQSFGLAWQFPRVFEPPPTAFLITYTAPDGQTLAQMQTPLSAPGACRTASADGNTFCTQWPGCPPAGVVVFWVQGVWSDGMSDPSTPQMVCLFTTDKPCVCQDPNTYAPPATPTAVVVPPLPPGEIPPAQVVMPPLPVFAPVFPPTPT